MKDIGLLLPLALLLGTILGCSETAKKPQWQKAQILADRIDHPAAVTTDDQFIYFVTGGTIASLDEGTSGVWKMPLAGGPPVQLFKGHQIDERNVVIPDTFVLAADEKFVYWSSGAIWRTPKAGGESEKIATGKPTEWALDETKIYWHNFGGENAPPTPIYAVDKTGGEVRAFSEPVIISGLAIDRENLYWAASDGIYKAARSGGPKTKVHAAPENQFISGLAADEQNLYFSQGGGRNALLKLPKQGGEAVRIAPDVNHASKFYAAGNFIYFIRNEGSFENSLNKVASGGGEIVQIDGGHAASFTVGKDKIFVTDISRILALEK